MITMRLLALQNRFLALSVVVLTSLSGGVLTACSTTSQAQNENSPTIANDTSDRQHMNHGMDMDLGPADADYDLRFIDAMILHHQGAVEMAQELQQKSTRPEMKKLAADIIKAQNQEIAQMQQWRTAWYPQAGVKPMAYHAKMGHMMEMSSEQIKAMKMSQDLGAADAEFDLRFLNAMIPHHEGALVMAQDAAQKSQRVEIKNLAQAIITAQNTEINQMQQWRTSWYKQ